MLYPFQLKPLFKQRIWGGRRLADLFEIPQDNGLVGEAWVVADHFSDRSHIVNGLLAGKTLGDILRQNPNELYGTPIAPEKFPLLVKLLDTSVDISIQVHPDHAYAAKFEGAPGKAELWYIIYAGPDAGIVLGLKPGVTSQVLSQSVSAGTIDDNLHHVKVKAGEFYYIPPGLVHALGKDILAAEVQVNSDITYRIHDYNRLDTDGLPRKLQVEKALSVINYDLCPAGPNHTQSFSCPDFRVDLLSVQGNTFEHQLKAEVEVLLIVEGAGRLQSKDTLALKTGDALVLPACLAKVQLDGNMKILRSRPGKTILGED